MTKRLDKMTINKKGQPLTKRVKMNHGGVGIQTHGGRLGSALNTQVPDHSKYLNEYGYLKGGVPVKNG